MIAVVLVALGAIFVVGQTSEGTKREGWGKKGMHRGGKMHHGGGMMFRGLDLTDAQKEQIKAIHEANKPAMQPLMEAMKQNRQKFREARKAGNTDQAALDAIKAERSQIFEQMKPLRESVKAQTLAVLTDEQKTKLEEMKQKRIERFKNRGNGRRGAKSSESTEQ